jgi:hypothetical protein
LDATQSCSRTSNSLQDYFKGKNTIGPGIGPRTPSTTLSNNPSATPASTDVFNLPVGPEFEKLTRSQRLFSIATQTDVRALNISRDVEFYLFMEMWSERQWVSFRMTPLKWVGETREYNSRLQKQDPTMIPKHPRALMDKLIVMEVKILERIATNNFKCKSATPTCL